MTVAILFMVTHIVTLKVNTSVLCKKDSAFSLKETHKYYSKAGFNILFTTD